MVNDKKDFYQNGKIYKIVDNTNGNIYIGSTCKKLCQRMGQHRTNYKSYLKDKSKYITSVEVMKNENYDIVLIENFPCESKEQLHARERYYIESHDCLNKCIPTRKSKEYYQDNKDKIKEYYQDNKDKIKEYYQDNKDKILERVKAYSENNKDIIAQKSKGYREKNKDIIAQKKKEYREKNKDSIAEKRKVYDEQNKEHLREYQKTYRDQNHEKLNENHRTYYENNKLKFNESINCPVCNAQVFRRGLNRHQKTLKCLAEKEKVQMQTK